MRRIFSLVLIGTLGTTLFACGDDDDHETLANFQGQTLATESHYTPDATGVETWTDGDASFKLFFDDSSGMDFWEGITYSNESDTTTPGFGNQYSAITGSGMGGEGIYAVAGTSSYNQAAEVTFPGGAMTVAGFYVTNTTYAYLSMRDGDDFTKKFGGADGSEPDWFLLTIHGLDASGTSIGTVEFYLADFRAADAADDYIVDTWTRVDLSSLGEVHGLRFAQTSTDVGEYGMNTPAYFAFDNLEY